MTLTKEEILLMEFLYRNQYEANIESIRQLIRDGKISVTVDYNRSGWRSDTPADGMIYRIKKLE